MSDTVIQVENLGKKYVLGHQQQGSSRYVALRDVLADGVRSVGHRLRHPLKPRARSNEEEFWALKDVSFEVKRGEVVGIIGRNGAGKSTLLKILSRITEPTEGRVRLRGRVASLLEVGTGFHPELTGRENIFLNGAILGMSRAEITRKFDEIVDFAEVERFLDTPVKRYSSGMYVRLAFAVAAHLEPEILVVDEVLAVGDAAFQKKCLGKMKEATQETGKTILFVSHNMLAMRTLCPNSILIDRGKIISYESTEGAIQRYFSISNFQESLKEVRHDPPLSSIKVENSYGGSAISCGDDVVIFIKTDKKIEDLRLIIGIYKQGVIISDLDHSKFPTSKNGASDCIEIKIKNISLTPGIYDFNLILASGLSVLNHYPGVVRLEVEDGVYSGNIIDCDTRGYCALNSEVHLLA